LPRRPGSGCGREKGETGMDKTERRSFQAPDETREFGAGRYAKI
jgi:hypothetical protein